MYCLIVFREAFSCASTCTMRELMSGRGLPARGSTSLLRLDVLAGDALGGAGVEAAAGGGDGSAGEVWLAVCAWPEMQVAAHPIMRRSLAVRILGRAAAITQYRTLP